jgi:hypothetical protein
MMTTMTRTELNEACGRAKRLLDRHNLMPLVESILRSRGCSLDDILGPSRHGSLVETRHECWHECKFHAHKRMSFKELGRAFNRDHSTIISGIRRHAELLDAGQVKRPMVQLTGRAAASWPECLPPMFVGGMAPVLYEEEPIGVAPPMASCEPTLCIAPIACEPMPLRRAEPRLDLEAVHVA